MTLAYSVALTAALDPLELDPFLLHILPTLNRDGNSDELMHQVRALDLHKIIKTQWSIPEAQAILRDLGFIAASVVKHHGVVEDFPGLAFVLCSLAQQIDEVPRDTLFSYTVRNPLQARTRTFTGTEHEQIFRLSVLDGVTASWDCLSHLTATTELELGSEAFNALLQEAVYPLQKMIQATLLVKKTIPTAIFNEEIRPYFPSMSINNAVYFAPSGAQMPILLVDWLLWGVNNQEVTYQDYFQDNLRYLPPELRQIVTSYPHQDSLIARLTKAAIGLPRTSANVKGFARALSLIEELLVQILQFRFPHLRLAQDSMEQRQGAPVGSGGYTLTMLKELLEHTATVRKTLSQLQVPT